MKSAHDALIRDFVPTHLGWDNITRDQIAQQSLQIPNVLFGNTEADITDRKAIIVCNGRTYILIKIRTFCFKLKQKLRIFIVLRNTPI